MKRFALLLLASAFQQQPAIQPPTPLTEEQLTAIDQRADMDMIRGNLTKCQVANERSQRKIADLEKQLADLKKPSEKSDKK
jgi:hypothetical protein